MPIWQGKEIGNRQSAILLRLVIRQGMVLTLTGLIVGIAAGAVATRVLSEMLYGVTTTDPLTFAGVPAFLLLVAFFACYIPGAPRHADRSVGGAAA